ncbi:MAG: 2-C-methyl-D-erythritol 2,4-cyclodiphosphate synthase [Muribaculaceae bacterium]|nr:2-C-methyl-D-erythritol 2,4-cyclodiphosphate synthase [Muribaculaceae bacterium]MDE5713029.1 2-C-methyl-D-erythritol 2,4-cyclodiphosphate synthase [Muribaculaceae bacterium]
MFRIGQGYDVHRLVEDRDLWICGIKLPHTHGLLGHSDADVAIHALCDAILGALALRDIGFHFPDTDPKYKGADSKLLLAEVCRMIRGKGWEIGNVDITIMAEAPKFKPHIDEMRECLANVMNIECDRVSVKATTTEGLGFTGRREGIAANAIALLYES